MAHFPNGNIMRKFKTEIDTFNKGYGNIRTCTGHIIRYLDRLGLGTVSTIAKSVCRCAACRPYSQISVPKTKDTAMTQISDLTVSFT